MACFEVIAKGDIKPSHLAMYLKLSTENMKAGLYSFSEMFQVKKNQSYW